MSFMETMYLLLLYCYGLFRVYKIYLKEKCYLLFLNRYAARSDLAYVNQRSIQHIENVD